MGLTAAQIETLLHALAGCDTLEDFRNGLRMEMAKQREAKPRGVALEDCLRGVAGLHARKGCE